MYIPWRGRALNGGPRRVDVGGGRRGARGGAGGFSIKYCADISGALKISQGHLRRCPFLASFCYSSQGKHLNDYSFEEEVRTPTMPVYLSRIWHINIIYLGYDFLV